MMREETQTTDLPIAVRGLSVKYRVPWRPVKEAVRNITLTVGRGEVLGLLGPNGTGKTTLIKSLIGLLDAPPGTVALFGQHPLHTAVRRRIGYMPEVATYYQYLSAAEVLRMFGGLCGMDARSLAIRIDEALTLVDLAAVRNERLRSFSKGMQGRLSLAQAILHDPEVLILDEPFSGLDPVGRIQTRAILAKLKNEGKTILLSSHELSEAELVCDTIAVMKDGAILVHDRLPALLAGRGAHSLEQYFMNLIGAAHA